MPLHWQEMVIAMHYAFHFRKRYFSTVNIYAICQSNRKLSTQTGLRVGRERGGVRVRIFDARMVNL